MKRKIIGAALGAIVGAAWLAGALWSATAFRDGDLLYLLFSIVVIGGGALGYAVASESRS